MTAKGHNTHLAGLKIGILPVAAAIFLSACSSSSTPLAVGPVNDDPADDLPGFVITGLNGMPSSDVGSIYHANVFMFRSNSNTQSGGDASVGLLEYRTPVTMENHSNFYAPDLETCEITDITANGGGSSGGDDPLTVSGGSTLTINSQGGPLIELPVLGEDFGTYGVNNTLPVPLPADATLSIPGDQFPNVAAYPLVEPVAPVRISPAAGVLGNEAVAAPFLWEALPNVPGGYMEIVALAFRRDGSFAGFPVICSVVDDGEFTLPADVVQLFAENTEFEIESRFERVIQRLDYINDIAFHQRSIISE